LILYQLAEYRAALAAFDAEEARLVAAPLDRDATLFAPLTTLRQVLCLVELGEFDEALARAERGFRRGAELQHGYSLAMAATARGLIDLRRGNAVPAVAALERARVLCFDGNYPMLLPRACGHLSSAYLLAGRVSDALRTAREACQHVHPPFAFVTLTLGEACLAAGQAHEAREIAEASATAARRLGDRGRLAWTLRLLGEIDARPADGAGTRASAAARFGEALALAGDLGMRPLAAHCHLDLGRLHPPASARPHLAQAVALYREMGMAHFLIQAEGILASLRD